MKHWNEFRKMQRLHVCNMHGITQTKNTFGTFLWYSFRRNDLFQKSRKKKDFTLITFQMQIVQMFLHANNIGSLFCVNNCREKPVIFNCKTIHGLGAGRQKKDFPDLSSRHWHKTISDSIAQLANKWRYKSWLSKSQIDTMDALSSCALLIPLGLYFRRIAFLFNFSSYFR